MLKLALWRTNFIWVNSLGYGSRCLSTESVKPVSNSCHLTAPQRFRKFIDVLQQAVKPDSRVIDRDSYFVNGSSRHRTGRFLLLVI